MTTTASATAGERWLASEPRRVPAHECDAVLRAAAEPIDAECRSSAELTAFDALGKDDLHVDSASTERGEIWLVDFDPAIGAEIRKLLSAVVIRVDALGRLPLRLVVPVSDRKASYASDPWSVELAVSPRNDRIKGSRANPFQVKLISESRFVRRLAELAAAQVDEFAEEVALSVGAP